ncbi:peptidylprolyl isomerase [Bartonella tamiae]|uniref:SurA N-terminal domain-containing protein n=1 Tax=Bartonella tamiae Th239 TaxID=1094558 RepID=J0QX97_9HYPH|nr:peptidylprolyl isomerase [Bartonella tamiae]EJF90671.1 hypothetical protein ME5_01072 [Bartonella tamiae Th239]EJF93952.1 hypothetical protein MEG_00810 [Bartonella tamiae Th307]
MKSVRICAQTFLMAAMIGIICLSSQALLMSKSYAQATVAVIVNGNAITNNDVRKRAAFLKLQQRKGNLNALAKEELIDEMLKRVEIKRRNIKINDDDVNNAYAGFAQQNNLTIDQLTQMLAQAGITAEHFKTYIGVQMGWGQLVSARYQSENGLISEQEAVQRMIKNGGKKPSTNEYSLQQVIFVVPANKRASIIGKRKQDANNFRAKFNGCNNLKQQSTTMLDVTVRNLGRILEPQLPEEWDKAVRSTPVGKMTPPIETKRGVEALAVCEIKKVSDDKVAQLVYSIEDSKKGGQAKAADLSDKYMKELRASARIKTP